MRRRSRGKASRERMRKWEQMQKEKKRRNAGHVLQGYFMAAQAGYGFVRTHRPGWPDIFIPRDFVGSAQGSDWVEVAVMGGLDESKVTKESRISGRVLKVLQRVDAKKLVDGSGEDMQLIMRQFGAPGDFPEDVLQEAAAAPQQLRPQDLAGRRDCRDLPLVTIDGVDSRDFDDAVYCRRLDNGNYRLSVHIADVAHYVPLRSALEQEAFARATSIYLPDRVLPMLPRELSNGICSLNAGQDRLALACDMEYTPRGRLVSHEIYQSVIRVKQRLDYDTVNAALLDNDAAAQADLAEVLPMLQDLAALQRVLAAKRHRRGALDFEFPELKVKLDAQGRVIDVGKRSSRLAEKMIEQAMLSANETVAEHFWRLQRPLVYRVHEGPTEEKLAILNEALLALALEPLPAAPDLKPKEVQKLLKQAGGTPTEDFVQLLTLRSMSHAAYAAKRGEHFGLAAKYYCHFTSPIRRYPDLLVHRVVKQTLKGGEDASLLPANPQKVLAYVEAAARQSSERELAAEEIERAAVKMKCCLFMQDKIGQCFAARVSGLTAKGLYVALPNGIEGHIPLLSLAPDEEYQYIEPIMLLKGKARSYTLGDELQVRLTAVDLLERRITFEEVWA